MYNLLIDNKYVGDILGLTIDQDILTIDIADFDISKYDLKSIKLSDYTGKIVYSEYCNLIDAVRKVTGYTSVISISLSRM